MISEYYLLLEIVIKHKTPNYEIGIVTNIHFQMRKTNLVKNPYIYIWENEYIQRFKDSSKNGH